LLHVQTSTTLLAIVLRLESVHRLILALLGPLKAFGRRLRAFTWAGSCTVKLLHDTFSDLSQLPHSLSSHLCDMLLAGSGGLSFTVIMLTLGMSATPKEKR